MNVGKTLFAQVMEFVPWTSFARIVDHYSGNAGVRRMTCADQFRIMAFAQLTWRESLRDIEVTLGANANKLYSMGLRHRVHRATLAEANETRDWRIWADIAALLIRRARKLYRDESLGVDLTHTVYALDATTIDLCLSLFDWAPFRSTKAAIKLHTLLDLRGAIPTFIHISDGKLHDVNVLDILPVEAGAFYVMDRGYLDFARLYALNQVGAFFVTRAKRNLNARRVYSATTDRTTGVICDQTIALNGFYVAKGYPDHLRRIRFNDPDTGKALVFLTNNTRLPPLTIAALYKSRWQVELFFKWSQATSAHQEIPRHQSERGEDANLVRGVYLCADRHRQKGIALECFTLHFATDSIGLGIRENPDFMRLADRCHPHHFATHR
jgi:Domain of unknown function (DUF4372)/Transposase DDE domain